MLTFSITPTDVESVACRLCGSQRYTDIVAVQCGGVVFFVTACCSDCGLLYRRIRPRFAWFENAWALRGAQQERDSFNPFNEAIEEARYRRYGCVAHVLSSFGVQGRIVDVASGPATGLKALQEAGYEVTGIEPDVTRARYMIVPGIAVLETTIEEYTASPHKPFAAATIIHALEHFHDPLDILRRMAQLVVPDGVIYVEVPDSRQFVVDWNDALTLVHLTNFTAETLTMMGEAAGLLLVGVAFPVADPPSRTHLGYIFRKHRGEMRLPRLATKQPDWKSVYSVGLPVGGGDPLRIEVAEINDLSLCYKAQPDALCATVHANFSGRVPRCDNSILVIGEKRG